MPTEYSVSLIIPAYQEEAAIAQALTISDNYLRTHGADYEIIVIDDGSTDKTGSIAENYASNNSHIVLIRNLRNEGSGRSLLTGLKAARFDLLVTNFADLPFDINELKEIERLLTQDVDFVVVTRKDRSANSFYRKTTSLVNYWLIRLLFGVKVSDFQFVQVYKRHVIEKIEVESKGTFVAPEIIIKAIRMGFVFKEYKADFYPRRCGKAKCGKPEVILQTICEMLRFWLKQQWICRGRQRQLT